MLAVQFNEVGGGAKSIQDIFTGNLPDMDVDEEGYPVWNAKFQTWTGTGYAIYYWTGSVGGALFEDNAYNNVWVVGDTGEGGVADTTTPIGEGVFLWTSGSGVTVQQAGEVATNSVKTVSISAGYNLICNPFPETINIQDVAISNLPDMDVDEEGYPVWNAKFQTWTGTGYAIYYWTGSVGGALFEDNAYNNVWVVGDTGEGGVADVDIGIGEPFFIWLRSGENVTATFTK